MESAALMKLQTGINNKQETGLLGMLINSFS